MAKRSNKTNAIGYLPLTYDLAIFVVGMDRGTEDYVVWRFSNESKIRRSKLHFDVNGEPYFKSNGWKYYLGEFMRMDYP